MYVEKIDNCVSIVEVSLPCSQSESSSRHVAIKPAGTYIELALTNTGNFNSQANTLTTVKIVAKRTALLNKLQPKLLCQIKENYNFQT